MTPREPTIVFHGPIAEHNQRCAVFEAKPAVYNFQTGAYSPSRAAQKEGWHLVQANNRLKRWILRTFFGVVER